MSNVADVEKWGQGFCVLIRKKSWEFYEQFQLSMRAELEEKVFNKLVRKKIQ